MEKTSKKRVLVVDDEPSDRQRVRQMLSNDYVVLEAEDGWEAIAMAYSEQPDLILLDVVMPMMDGYTVCHAIKKDPITKAIPVVMLTALSQELNDVLSRKLGAADHITKPLTERKLLDTLNKFLPAASTSHHHSVSKVFQNTLCPLG
jgi:putative two-component system response regulator